MEILFLLALVYVVARYGIIGIVEGIMGFLSSIFGDGNWSNQSKPSEFEVKLVQEFITTDTARHDCFTFKIKGTVGNPTGGSVKVIIRLLDEADNKKAHIYAIPSSYHADKTGLFGLCEPLPAADPTTFFPEFVSFGSIPKEWLQFPYKGKRTIVALAILADAACDESNFESIKKYTINYSDSTSTYNVSDIGYMDNFENRDRTNELSIDLCMLLAASDGTLDQAEVDVMKDWARLTYIFMENQSDKEEQKKKISTYIKNSYQKAKTKELNKNMLIKEINEIFDNTAKYNLMELLLKIAGADDVFATKEEEFISQTARDLSLDQSTVSEMKNKVIIGIKEVQSTDDSGEGLLGITDDMTNEEKLKSLRKSYSKWNAQTTHKDANIRKRAKEMIEIIAKLNIKYKN